MCVLHCPCTFNHHETQIYIESRIGENLFSRVEPLRPVIRREAFKVERVPISMYANGVRMTLFENTNQNDSLLLTWNKIFF